MISPAVRFEVTPSPIWDAFVAYRPLFLADRTDSFAATGVRDRTGRSGNFAGQQIETRLRYWVIPDAMLLDTGTGGKHLNRSLARPGARPHKSADGDAPHFECLYCDSNPAVSALGALLAFHVFA